MGALCESAKSKRSLTNTYQTHNQVPNSKQIDNDIKDDGIVQVEIGVKPGNSINSVKKNKENQVNKVRNENCDIRNKENINIVRKIGEVKGEQIIIAYCKNASIIILDYSAQVTIEGCTNCNIFIAPCCSR